MALQNESISRENLSLTATFIMIKLWGLLQYPSIRALFPDDLSIYTSRLISSLPHPLSLFHKQLQSRAIRYVLSLLNEIGLKGDLGHIIARKKITFDWLDHEIGKQSKGKQFIFLGGGLDFAPVYTALQGYSTFAFEMPRTADLHRRFLRDHHYLSPNHHIISSPKGAPLYDTLISHPDFKKHTETIVITEGFWDYLTIHRVHSLLDEINHLTESCSRIELWSTLFVRSELPWIYRWSYRQSVKSVGELLQFDYTKSEFLSLLDETGAVLEELIDYTQMEKNILDGLVPSYSVLKGFYIGRWEF